MVYAYVEEHGSFTRRIATFECHLHQRYQVCTREVSLKTHILFSVGSYKNEIRGMLDCAGYEKHEGFLNRHIPM